MPFCRKRHIFIATKTVNFTVHVLFSIFQHAILVLKMCVTYAIPNQPQWINQEMARLEFQRRDALKASLLATKMLVGLIFFQRCEFDND